MGEISRARSAAFRILLAVERGEAHSDDLLRAKSVSALEAADRNLTTALVLGTLRWQIALDARLKQFLKKPNAKLDAEVQLALRMGAFQLLHMDRIPARAAIDESVELTKQAGHLFASGMVNAVLRKLSGAPRVEELEENNAAAIALAFAHPQWMLERWIARYGPEAARAICEHGQKQPALTVRVMSAEDEEELARAGVTLEPGKLVTAARTIMGGDVTATKAFREGRVRIQDEGSQLVAELASAGDARLILDACAAPGGKTMVLAERNPAAHVVACEWNEKRLGQMRMRLSALDDRVECRQSDATALTEESTYDAVLADVPCSGTGTLGRNPEIRHRLTADDFARQSERQQAILRGALRTVKVGGQVVYSTCSLEREENEDVVAAVLTSGARVVPLDARIAELGAQGVLTGMGAERLRAMVADDGMLRLMPDAFGTDVFFVAVVEKVGPCS